MPICDRKIQAIHFDKIKEVYYADLIPADGSPGNYTQEFPADLFFGWYKLLEDVALAAGVSIQVTQTGQLTNWTLPLFGNIIIQNKTNSFDAFVTEDSNYPNGFKLLGFSILTPFVKDTGGYHVQYDYERTGSEINRSVAVRAVTKFGLITVETIDVLTNTGTAYILPTNPAYDNIEITFTLKDVATLDSGGQGTFIDAGGNAFDVIPSAGHLFWQVDKGNAGDSMRFYFPPSQNGSNHGCTLYFKLAGTVVGNITGTKIGGTDNFIQFSPLPAPNTYDTVVTVTT